MRSKPRSSMRALVAVMAVVGCQAWASAGAAAGDVAGAAGDVAAALDLRDAGAAPLAAVDEAPDDATATGDDATATDDDATATDDDAESAGESEGAEAEAAIDSALLPVDGGYLYSADLTDEALEALWATNPGQLGSISFGLTEAGRLMNGVQMPAGPAWQVVDAANAWGTKETIDALVTVASAVREQFPSAPPLRINHIGRQNGGYLRPHQSHQSGRDVDLGFFYPNGEDPGRLSKRREQAMDLATNWVLLKNLIINADVQFVLVDKRIQARLYDYALKLGEDKAWLDRLFHAGASSLVKHARRHRDHFHVRFFSARSQELGRRVQPLLAKQPDQNLTIYRVKKGDTLGRLAAKFNSSVKLIQKANGLLTTALRVGRTLNIPLRGPCTTCPMPPPVVLPARCLPPERPDES